MKLSDELFSQITNILFLHQSEKSFIYKRIHSKIVIDYMYKTKHALFKNECTQYDAANFVISKIPKSGILWTTMQITDMGMKAAKSKILH